MNKLKLNKTIYDKGTILFAISRFKDIANITIEESDIYWDIIITDSVYNPDVTIKEFENYLIDSTIS